MSNAEKISKFLNEAGVWYFLTTDGEQPKGRPFNFHIVKDDTIYFGTGTFKGVYQQLQKNRHVEILAVNGDEFLRYDGEVVFEESEELSKDAIAATPQLQNIYNEQTGLKLGMFHLENGKVEICTPMGQKEAFEL